MPLKSTSFEGPNSGGHTGELREPNSQGVYFSGPSSRDLDHPLRHLLLIRVRVRAADIDRIEAKVQNLPTAESSRQLREYRVISRSTAHETIIP